MPCSRPRTASTGPLALPPALDPLQRLVEGVGVGEDVVGRLPIRMLICGSKTCHAERRRIGKCFAKVGRRSPGPRSAFQLINDTGRFFRQKPVGQIRMVRPPARAAADRDETKQFTNSALAQGVEVNGLAPRCRFLGTARFGHLADDGRQHLGRILPADEIETLERLVDEVERVTAVRVYAVRLGRKQQICQFSWRGATSNGCQNDAFSRLAMGYRHPPTQPALQSGEFDPARQRRPFAAGRCAVHSLGDDEAKVVRETITEPPTPMFNRIGIAEHRLHPDLAAGADFDGAGRRVVSTQIESAAADELEARMVPMARRNAVLDAAAIEWETHTRAAIVEGRTPARCRLRVGLGDGGHG